MISQGQGQAAAQRLPATGSAARAGHAGGPRGAQFAPAI